MIKAFRHLPRTAALCSLAVVAAALAACGGSIAFESSSGATSGTSSTGSTGSSGSGGSTACPTTEPQQGAACAVSGQSCSYAQAHCGGSTVATCSGGVWSVVTSIGTCGCPAQLPADGSPCDPCCTESCSFGPGTCVPVAHCAPNGTWVVSFPECPVQPCATIMDSTVCAAALQCRWLVPACGGPSVFPEGCFDAQDCVLGTVCPSGQSCMHVDTDPCGKGGCSLCSGGAANICAGPG